jgi:hypothetical protein
MLESTGVNSWVNNCLLLQLKSLRHSLDKSAYSFIKSHSKLKKNVYVYIYIYI